MPGVKMGDHDTCQHCKKELTFDRPPLGNDWADPRWWHSETKNAMCDPEAWEALSRMEQRRSRSEYTSAKPIHWCDERLTGSRYNEVCNRPIKDPRYGKCGVHEGPAKAEYERNQRAEELRAQDAYVEEALGSQVEYWNMAYDLDAKLEKTDNWENRYGDDNERYRSGYHKYTGYVLVNPARLAELMKRIEEEF